MEFSGSAHVSDVITNIHSIRGPWRFSCVFFSGFRSLTLRQSCDSYYAIYRNVFYAKMCFNLISGIKGIESETVN